MRKVGPAGRAGRKRSHWIWYRFPQLAGLGSSERARHFGVRGRAEAEAYLRDDVLRKRLVDALKLVSSLTLFEAVATDVQARESPDGIARIAALAGQILAVAEAQGYPRCALTLDRMRDAG